MFRKAVFLLLSLLPFFAEAQCVIQSNETIVINNNNNTSNTHPFQGCSKIIVNGTLVINRTLDLQNLGAINFIISGDDAKIVVNSNNTSLSLADNSSLILNNGGFVELTTPCSNNRRIRIGDIEYAACNGGGNVIYLFSELNSTGGSTRALIESDKEEVEFGENFKLSLSTQGVIPNFETEYRLSVIQPNSEVVELFNMNESAFTRFSDERMFNPGNLINDFEYTSVGEYTFIFTLNQKDINFTSESSFTVNVREGSLLPVELISFDVENKYNKYVSLTWKTATEINNEGFEVQRSNDGKNFESIAWVEGNFNSREVNHYTFEDYEPLEEISYYRLKQIDYDGAFEYLPIKSVKFENSPSVSYKLKHDRHAELVIFEMNASDSAFPRKLMIANQTGRIVYVSSSIEHNSLSIQTTSFKNGVYYYTIEGWNSSIQGKFLISR